MRAMKFASVMVSHGKLSHFKRAVIAQHVARTSLMQHWRMIDAKLAPIFAFSHFGELSAPTVGEMNSNLFQPCLRPALLAHHDKT